MILKRFYSLSVIKFQPTSTTTQIPLEKEDSMSVEDRNKLLLVGEYEVLNDSVYSVFSFQKSNYLFLMDRTIEITKSIDIKYRVNYSKNDKSYFEIFNNGETVIRVEYYNHHDPLINPLDGDEDWEYVNFAYHIYLSIKKVKENSSVVLFPN